MTCFEELFGAELPELLAAAARPADEAGPGEDVQVFGDGLARDARSGRVSSR